ncbi:PAS/PAC sensor hybrid histidine kinase [Planoprotostelium fungivorum]|uniref:PAS/PAC sensor hybrid histidine kinase n=1 Tax=Planoprotostelium fungivorum TaxID=1890364 RepID=A0A2P6NS23_9EUKA|nr:PAS/PAC sensor hybrid histidine kinase [Planoprotostelium fungivorum]
MVGRSRYSREVRTFVPSIIPPSSYGHLDVSLVGSTHQRHHQGAHFSRRTNEMQERTPKRPRMTLEDGEEGSFVRDGRAEELKRMFEETKWEETKLGPKRHWPQAFHDVMQIAFQAEFPTALYLGKNLCTIYNAGFARMFEEKHPHMWAMPMEELWSETWHVVGPLIHGVIESGKGFYASDHLLILKRGEDLQEMYFTFAYSPVTEGRHVVGILVNLLDTSQQVYSRRQTQVLKDLNNIENISNNEERTVAILNDILNKSSYDIPCYGLYIVSDDKLLLRSHSFGEHSSNFPCSISHRPSEGGNIFENSIQSAAIQQTEVLITENCSVGPFGEWSLPVTRWVALPFEISGSHHKCVLLCGLNQRRRWDRSYRNFMQLVSSQVSVSLSKSRIREELTRKAVALSQMDRQRTIFFSNVSHEFKTPITLMLGPMEDFDARNLSAKHARQIPIVKRNVVRLLHLVNRLLDFNASTQGEMAVKYSRVNLGQVTEDLAALFSSAFEQRNIEFLFDCTKVKKVYVDIQKWEVLVMNLVSNAFKYTERGRVVVRLQYCEEKGWVEFSVKDTGVGIREEHLPRVMERFYTVRENKTQYASTGIGLSVVNTIVNLHHGTIGIASQGTTVTIRIPVGSRKLCHSTTEFSPSIANPNHGGFSVNSYLSTLKPSSSSESVSDEGGILYLVYMSTHHMPSDTVIDEILEGQYELRIFLQPSELMEATKERLPTLFLLSMDDNQEEMELLIRNIRDHRDCADIPILLYTNRRDQSQAEWLDRGVDECIVPPYSDAELMTRVAATIRQYIEQTEVRKRDQELRKQAEIAKNAKDTFLASVAHELRTPLAPVLMQLEDMVGDTSIPRRRQKQISTILKAVHSEIYLVDNLLDMVKIGRGKLVLNREEVNVDDIIRQVATVVQDESGADCPKIKLSLDAAIHHAQADPTRLRQVFWNILKNAVKFGRSGHVIDVRTFNSPDGLTLSVQIIDYGMGIDDARISHLFEPIEQDVSGINQYKDTGLGTSLHISRSIMMLHGGAIDVRSEGLDRGSTFTVTIPCQAATEKNAPVQHVEAPQVSVRILLVEDNESIRMVMNRILTVKMNHTVRTAPMVGTAMDIASDWTFDLLISDIGLPDGTGYDLIRNLIQTKGKSFRSIALSGYSLPEDVQASIEAGFDIHMTKPVQTAILQQTIQRLFTS